MIGRIARDKHPCRSFDFGYAFAQDDDLRGTRAKNGHRRQQPLDKGEDVSPCARSVVNELVVRAQHFYHCSYGVRHLDGKGVVGCLDVHQDYGLDIDGVVVGLEADLWSGLIGLFVDGYVTSHLLRGDSLVEC